MLPADAGQYPFSEFLAVRLLASRGAVLLHASAAVHSGGAYLFFGHSGAGKSTIASIAAADGAQILSDDRTILARDGASVRAWGTPWHGTGRQSSPKTALVRRVHLLKQAPHDRLVPMDAGRASKELFVRLIQPRVRMDEVLANLDALDALVPLIPFYELHFRPTAAAFRLAVRGTDAVAGGPGSWSVPD